MGAMERLIDIRTGRVCGFPSGKTIDAEHTWYIGVSDHEPASVLKSAQLYVFNQD